MSKKILLMLTLPIVLGWASCDPGDGGEDSGNPWGTDDDTENGNGDGNYICVPDEEVDAETCGEYPEHTEGLWDIDSVVPNTTFKAYYDRDCDGEPEVTEMRMYEDVYCQRDKVKSLVLAVGSNCGTEGGGT